MGIVTKLEMIRGENKGQQLVDLIRNVDDE